jgi:malonate transporter MadL subunit
MAMQQNVVTALRGGPVALLAAVGSVLGCGLLVSAINRTEPPGGSPPADQDRK